MCHRKEKEQKGKMQFTVELWRCLQVMVSLLSSATLLTTGINLGFSAVALQQMQDPAGTDRLTVDEGSWFGRYRYAA
jgi:hypothetical protein